LDARHVADGDTSRAPYKSKFNRKVKETHVAFSISNFFENVEKAGMKVGDFLANAIRLGNAIKQMWSQCGTQTITVASQVFYDVMKTATLTTEAAASGQAGAWAG